MVVDTVKYYNNLRVASEIYEFLKKRWIALEEEATTEGIFIRYYRDKPLQLTSSENVPNLTKRDSGLKIRAFYATIRDIRISARGKLWMNLAILSSQFSFGT